MIALRQPSSSCVCKLWFFFLETMRVCGDREAETRRPPRGRRLASDSIGRFPSAVSQNKSLLPRAAVIFHMSTTPPRLGVAAAAAVVYSAGMPECSSGCGAPRGEPRSDGGSCSGMRHARSAGRRGESGYSFTPLGRDGERGPRVSDPHVNRRRALAPTWMLWNEALRLCRSI